MQYTRRAAGKMALAGLSFAGAFGARKIDSRFGGVQIGAITYSFNRIASPDPEAIIKAYVRIGIGEAELMSNHCEALAGAPASARPGGGRAALTPEQQAAQQRLRQWRTGTGPETWKGVRRKFNDAGVQVTLLCYNMNDNMKDD